MQIFTAMDKSLKFNEIKSYLDAERIVSRYAEVGPLNANLLYSLAGLQYHLGKKDHAKATATKVLAIKADHKGAHDLQTLIQREQTVQSLNQASVMEDGWKLKIPNPFNRTKQK